MAPLTRRTFLTTAAGAAFAPPAWAAMPAAVEPLVADLDYRFTPRAPRRPARAGIIGVGGRGSVLLERIVSSRQAEVAAICDIRPGAIRDARAIARGMAPRGFADYRDLLAMRDLEAVFIATPVDLHAEMAVAALAAGKHVYCEKPLGVDAAAIAAVERAAAGSDRVFQAGLQWHYNARFRAALEAARRGLIGDVMFIDARRHTAGDLPPKPWLMDRARSGDIIVEQAVHELNVLCWAKDAAPARACGFGGTNVYVNRPEGRTIMDHYSLSMEFADGCRVAYSHMFYAQRGLDGMHVRLFGSKGAIDAGRGEIYLRDSRATPKPREMKLTPDDTFNAIYDFFERIRRGGAPAAGVAGAARANRAALMGRLALDRGDVAEWAEAALP